MPLSEVAIRTKAENFQNSPNAKFDLYVISFICTNFDAFTTFSGTFTHICCMIRLYDLNLVHRVVIEVE